MTDKDKQVYNREYHREYNKKHRAMYTHKYRNESRRSAQTRFAADVLIPLQNRIDTEGFINGTKC